MSRLRERRAVRAAALVVAGLIGALDALSPAQLLAQTPNPLGSEFEVNSYTTGKQYHASVSLDADGDFVVVWQSAGSFGTDSSFYSIQGQRYLVDGTPNGGEFQVNTYTTTGQYRPSVSLDADGDFVVVWDSIGSDGTDTSYNSVQGQRYAADGTPQGDQFQVNTYTTLRQYRARVSLDADGDFVVVWQSAGSYDTDDSNFSIQGQRFAADATPRGGEFQVNSYTTFQQLYPAVSLDADGDFAVVWRSDGSYGTDSSSFSIQGRRFAADATPQGPDFQVNTYTTSAQRQPSVSLDADGDFEVAWSSNGSYGSDSDGYSIQAQRYLANGMTQGGEFQVNSYTTAIQYRAAVSLDADGDFVVVWQSAGSYGTDTSVLSIQGQRFAADCTPLGDQFQVNSYTSSTQYWSAVSLDTDSHFTVVWGGFNSLGNDTSNTAINGQRYEVPFFGDGFESGNTSKWTSTVP